jgi:hypothetical protein
MVCRFPPRVRFAANYRATSLRPPRTEVHATQYAAMRGELALVWVGMTPIPVVALLFGLASGKLLMRFLLLRFPALIGADFMVIPSVGVVMVGIFHGDGRLFAACQSQQQSRAQAKPFYEDVRKKALIVHEPLWAGCTRPSITETM